MKHRAVAEGGGSLPRGLFELARKLTTAIPQRACRVHRRRTML